jgi:fructose-bisphosphate aldolase, class I
MSSLEDPQVSEDLENIAPTLVSDAKGILAADESVKTSTRRFDAVGIQSTEESRRAYREILFTTTGASEFISGAILYDETIRQTSSDGTPFAQVLSSQNIVPGIQSGYRGDPARRLARRERSLRGSTGCGIG